MATLVGPLRGLHYLFLSGEDMARGDFKAMLGISERATTDALGAVVRRGLRKARFAFACRSTRRVFFPRLWPEAQANAVSH